MKLLLVGLPLGNIEDISLRAIRALQEAKLVICEDTRVFRKLWLKLENLGYLTGGFSGKLSVINDFNEKKKVPELIGEIQAFDEAVLVTDAGMPTISDPGFRLVKQVIEMGGAVTSAPGPSAVTTALCLSGLSSDKVLFLGFLPKKKSKRERYWEASKSFSALGLTLAIYEPARSVYKTLEEIFLNFGDVEVVIARELTKKFEEVIRGTASGVMEKIKEKGVKGELVLLWRLSKEKKG
ncbi:16S rRNA (cytidine(1402)-2'-O)-methyltransferase [Patescibacteria group bacterium]|nr:16S rRNA (cytidine(1402)-2'-O)-methyltransferase [Patescibacteria group bacterium]MBU1256568.1 16S rRNA (cytidine(1402)-2'-O)-methyltransferase [Patescibacteria group bacterium]MBU1457154.1 16S rRNA (cytidine(1402)-2'-O)-methyltransferase [Patescibacteria group bacterium]